MFSFSPQVIYIQVSADRLMLRNPKTGLTISEVPEVAIARVPKEKILGIGTDARKYQAVPSVEIVNPFAHPRSMMSDFTLGEQTLKAFLTRMKKNAFSIVAPNVVMHLMGEPEGGFTQVELRAFLEMAIGSGASRVTIWQGCPLTDQDLLVGRFPVSGKVLS